MKSIFLFCLAKIKLFLSNSIFSLSNLSSKVGKLLGGRHSKLKSEFFDLRLNLFSDLREKFISVPAGIFLKMSKRTLAESLYSLLEQLLIEISRHKKRCLNL